MSGEAEAAATAPALKVDPESLVLRASPARVTRFRRGAIIAIAATGSAAIMGVAWLALRPTELGILSAAGEDRLLTAKTPSDALAGAPKSYGDVPKLGPPLPGDLGRPILARQRELEAADIAQADAEARAAQAAETERLRIEAELRAVRQSSVMMPLGARSGAGAVGGAVDEVRAETPAAVDADGARRPTASAVYGKSGSDNVSTHRLEDAISPWMLHAGSIIAASLITGLNSELPGFVTAHVTENVYDSVSGRTLLIPQGARLIGSYESDIAHGQSRALVVWQRILFPDGASIQLDSVPATDAQGHAGLRDRTDRHGWQLLKGVILSTMLGVGTELGYAGESEIAEAIRESGQRAGARAGDQVVGKSLDIKPTLKVRPGWPLRVVVHKDIVLRPWQAGP